MQGLVKAFLAPFVVTQALVQNAISAFVPKLAEQIQKQALEQKNKDFIESIKKDPDMLIQVINRDKNKVLTKIENIKQKIIDRKKSIAKLTSDIASSKKKIKQLEKDPGKARELEILKNREKEILKILIELEQVRIKELEKKKTKLISEKESMELQAGECQLRLNELDEQKLSFEQAMSIASKCVQPLQKVLQQSRKENAMRRQKEPAQVSYGNLAFRATLDSDFNMHNVESAKVMPMFSRVGKETPEFIKQRLQRAAEHGLTPTPSTQFHEHGGKDSPDR